jgi:pimeloyl-ACP methyl ester carboxylesterase
MSYAGAMACRILAFLILFAVPAVAASEGRSEYPFHDAYEATVLGTPEAEEYSVPQRYPYRVRTIVRFPERVVAPIFQDGNELDYAESLQDAAAPLAFVIAGTGDTYDASKPRFLHAALWGAGFHVATISSPTHPEFIAAGSASMMPGYTPADARDLYAVMQAIRDGVASRAAITRTVLVGFSLGATEAAFVAALDAREKEIGLSRVYLINPPVDLYSSAGVLDELYRRSLPEGMTSAVALIDQYLRRAIHYFHSSGRGALDFDFLFRFVASEQPSDVDLAGIIGASFRLSASAMVFGADVLTGSGGIVSAEKNLGIGDSLTKYFEESLRISFQDYVAKYAMPLWQKHEGQSPPASILYDASLLSIAGFLRQAEHISMATNADDFLINADNLEFLKTTFAERIRVYPLGGHCGNMTARPNIERMLHLLDAPVRASVEEES